MPFLSRTGVIAELARFEGRRLLRSWLVRISLLVSAGYTTFESMDELPVLDRASVTLAWGLLPLIAATVLVACYATLRTVDPDREEMTAAVPASRGFRLGGIGLGLLVPATAGFTLQLAALIWLLSWDPASNVVWAEVLIGPVALVAYGAMAIAVTRLFRRAAVGPLLLVGIVGGTLALPYDPSLWGRYRGPEWLSFLPPSQDLIPQEFAFRPSWVHLAYVLAATATLILLAVVRLQWAELLGSMFALGVTIALGTSQLGAISAGEREAAASLMIGSRANLVCEERPGVRYCAMPGYEGWIDNWAEVADPVVGALPPLSAVVELRQYPTHNVFLLGDDEFSSNWWWLRPASEDFKGRDRTAPLPSMWATFNESHLGFEVAFTALDCLSQCDGEGLIAVASWLSAQSDVGEAWLKELSSERPLVGYCVAFEILARPELVPVLHSNWETATSPHTSYEDLGVILGIDIPKGADGDGRLPSRCP